MHTPRACPVRCAWRGHEGGLGSKQAHHVGQPTRVVWAMDFQPPGQSVCPIIGQTGLSLFGFHHLGQQIANLLDGQLLAADVLAFVLLRGCDLHSHIGELAREQDSGFEPGQG